MDSKETVQAVMDSIEKGDFGNAKALISADFQFSGPVPKPMNGDGWLEMNKNLRAAFPNLEYHMQVEGSDGDTVNISVQLKGTHTGEWDLTAMKMGVIPATNRSFAAAKSPGKATVKGDKVTSWALEPTEGASLMSTLQQLGIKPPAM